MNFINGKLTRNGDKVTMAFDGCDSQIVAPNLMFTKVEPKYLKGEIIVCIGMRVDDIVIDKNVDDSSDHVVKMKISHTEQLGTETLVYGDLNLNAGSFDQFDTGIIVKPAGFDDFSSDEV